MTHPGWNNPLIVSDDRKPRIIRSFNIRLGRWVWLCYRPADGFLSGVGVCETPQGAYYEWQYS